MSRHNNRTIEGDRKTQKHQDNYEKWWLNKTIDLSPMSINGKLVKGKIVNVKYIGNSVYGLVQVTLCNGAEYLISSYESFRPKKSELKFVDEIETVKPLQ